MNISEAIQKLETEWDMTDTDSFFFKVRDGEFDQERIQTVKDILEQVEIPVGETIDCCVRP